MMASGAQAVSASRARDVGMARIGNRFLAEHGEAAARALLLATPPADGNREALMMADFRAARTVDVAGFRLSRTEVADCLRQTLPRSFVKARA